MSALAISYIHGFHYEPPHPRLPIHPRSCKHRGPNPAQQKAGNVVSDAGMSEVFGGMAPQQQFNRRAFVEDRLWFHKR